MKLLQKVLESVNRTWMKESSLKSQAVVIGNDHSQGMDQQVLWPEQEQKVSSLLDTAQASATDRSPLSTAIHEPQIYSPRILRALQDVLLPEGLLAAKLSAGCSSVAELQTELISHLNQNSQETRTRYTQSILRWFFPDGISGLARCTWTAYQDEVIEIDILRSLSRSRAVNGQLYCRSSLSSRRRDVYSTSLL
jgi:hypothetical protein